VLSSIGRWASTIRRLPHSPLNTAKQPLILPSRELQVTTTSAVVSRASPELALAVHGVVREMGGGFQCYLRLTSCGAEVAGHLRDNHSAMDAATPTGDKQPMPVKAVGPYPHQSDLRP
jgi:hypothetical protein